MTSEFFFSYARANRDNAFDERLDGSRFNLLDQFFDRLCRRLSDITGSDASEVGYRDLARLGVSDKWPQNLAEALQTSKVLIALVTPNYLNSLNCGREFYVFLKRFELTKQTKHSTIRPAPIIPVFWMNSDYCWEHATDLAKKFLREFQLTEESLPENYPNVGVYQQITLGGPQISEKICLTFAERIKKLADLESLPQLEGVSDFRDLPSAFDPKQTDDLPVQPVQSQPVRNLTQMAPPAGGHVGGGPPALNLGP